MTEEEKIQVVQSLVDNDEGATSAVVEVYLAVAKNTILSRLYPYGIPEDVTDIPSRYDYVQCRLAMRYFLRRGAEGEISHSENGIGRTYGSVNDGDILSEVVPYARLVNKQ